MSGILSLGSEQRRYFAVIAAAVALTLVAAMQHPVDTTELRLPGVVWDSGRSHDTPGAAVDPALSEPGSSTPSIIVQARPGAVGEAKDAVAAVGGSISEDLPIVNGFSAVVPREAIDKIASSSAIRVLSADHGVAFEEFSYDEESTASNFAKATGATGAWAKGYLGEGVGVAVIDTGISSMNDFEGRLVFGPDLSGEGTTIDSYGHGTVMAGLIGGNGADSAGNAGGAYTGVAPRSTLVSVKAAGRNGATDVSTMLQAMHWVSAYKDQYNIRVLNLSWGTPSQQDPSLDPVNYAVQRLWREGIVVVVAAGNSGPQSGTVTKPGDDPLAITVGALDDKQNTDPGDDNVPGWSSRGPTAQGLVKPDIVTPGRTVIASRSYGSYVEETYPKALVSPSYIRGSGTSQSAAITSGLAALLLQARPELTPDEVKALLKGTAELIPDKKENDQGSGRINLAAALAAAIPDNAAQTSDANAMGSIEASRGGWNVETDCGDDGTIDVIKGEIDVRCEPWDPAAWTGSSWTGSSWTGSSWTGSSWTGSSWTGSSWTGSSWTGSSWTGGTWTGDSWQGSSWTGSSWTGSSWTGSSWTGSSWTGSSWTGSSWTESQYTTAEYEEELFLTAFFGDCTPPGVNLTGEWPCDIWEGLLEKVDVLGLVDPKISATYARRAVR